MLRIYLVKAQERAGVTSSSAQTEQNSIQNDDTLSERTRKRKRMKMKSLKFVQYEKYRPQIYSLAHRPWERSEWRQHITIFLHVAWLSSVWQRCCCRWVCLLWALCVGCTYTSIHGGRNFVEVFLTMTPQSSTCNVEIPSKILTVPF